MPDPLSRKEKRALARRNQILDAATKVFAEKGFQKATTREIAETAEISEGTIYNYFENKDELLLGLLDRISDIQNRPAQLEEALGQDFEESLIEMAVQRIHMLGTQLDTFLAVFPEILVNPDLRERFRTQFAEPLAGMMEKHVQQRIDRGEARPVDPALFTRYAFGASQGMLLMLVLGDPVVQKAWENREKFEEELIRFIFEGILPTQEG
jgi:AcrR family transcriptional regulator